MLVSTFLRHKWKSAWKVGIYQQGTKLIVSKYVRYVSDMGMFTIFPLWELEINRCLDTVNWCWPPPWLSYVQPKQYKYESSFSLNSQLLPTVVFGRIARWADCKTGKGVVHTTAIHNPLKCLLMKRLLLLFPFNSNWQYKAISLLGAVGLNSLFACHHKRFQCSGPHQSSRI